MIIITYDYGYDNDYYPDYDYDYDMILNVIMIHDYDIIDTLLHYIIWCTWFSIYAIWYKI